MLDTDKRPRKKTQSRNVVHQKNNENIMDWKMSNEEEMEMAVYKRPLLKTCRKRQLQFFWHRNKADGLEKQILNGKICGTKNRGRQCTKYTDSWNNFIR